MKVNKRTITRVSLILGMAFLILGLATDNETFSIAAIVFVVISMVTSGKWFRLGRR